MVIFLGPRIFTHILVHLFMGAHYNVHMAGIIFQHLKTLL